MWSEAHGQSADESPERGLALFDEIVARASDRARRACAHSERWDERIRLGLRALLEFAEEHPDEARFLLIDAMASGDALRHRQLAERERLVAIVDAGRALAAPILRVDADTAVRLTQTALAVIQESLVGDSHVPLSWLAGPLASMVVYSYGLTLPDDSPSARSAPGVTDALDARRLETRAQPFCGDCV